MRAIVTGAAGFIGSHLSEALVNQGVEVVGIDAMTPFYDRRRKEANLARLLDRPPFQWREGDIALLDWRELGNAADVVFHLAGQAGVRTAWGSEFAVYVRHNLTATQHMLEGLRLAARPPRVVIASSSSIYGNAVCKPTPESAPALPVSPYGITKYAAERLAFVYGDAFGIAVTALRFFTVYGPRQRPDMAFHRFFSALRQASPIAVFGDGKQTRDFTYVGDAVSACLAAAASIEAVGEAINIGGGHPVSLNDTLDLMERVSGRTFARTVHPAQPGDVGHTSADTAKAKRLFGYAPQTPLSDGLQAMWQWLESGQ